MELKSEFTEKWLEIKSLMAEDKFSAVVKESYPFLENLLKDLILEYQPKLEYRQRRSLLGKEEEFGKGRRGIESFTLGLIVQILQSEDIDFINSVSKLLKKDSEILKSINFGYLKTRRNEHGHYVTSGTHSEAQYFISSIEIILSFFDIKIIDLEKLQEEIANLKKELSLLKEQKGSVEEVSSLSLIYERYGETITNIDLEDTCYYDYEEPFVKSITTPKDIYEKVHYGNTKPKKLRGILNLSNKRPIPWVLLYRFVKDYKDINDGNYQYRGFYCFSNASLHTPLIHTILLYNIKEIDNGYLILHLFENDTKQRNLLIQNKPIFKFFRSAYDDLFQSSEVLDAERIKKIYEETYGSPNSLKDLEENIRSYYSKLPDSEDNIKQAIEVWKEVFNF